MKKRLRILSCLTDSYSFDIVSVASLRYLFNLKLFLDELCGILDQKNRDEVLNDQENNDDREVLYDTWVGQTVDFLLTDTEGYICPSSRLQNYVVARAVYKAELTDDEFTNTLSQLDVGLVDFDDHIMKLYRLLSPWMIVASALERDMAKAKSIAGMSFDQVVDGFINIENETSGTLFTASPETNGNINNNVDNGCVLN